MPFGPCRQPDASRHIGRSDRSGRPLSSASVFDLAFLNPQMLFSRPCTPHLSPRASATGPSQQSKPDSPGSLATRGPFSCYPFGGPDCVHEREKCGKFPIPSHMPLSLLPKRPFSLKCTLFCPTLTKAWRGFSDKASPVSSRARQSSNCVGGGGNGSGRSDRETERARAAVALSCKWESLLRRSVCPAALLPTRARTHTPAHFCFARKRDHVRTTSHSAS